MFGIVRWIRNWVEDVAHPRPAFEVEINGRTHEGRALVIGKQRELTRAGAYASIDTLQAAAKEGRSLSPAELADHLDNLIDIAAAGLRRPREWIERHVTAEEVGRIVGRVVAVSIPQPKEGDKRPPA